MHVCTTVHAHSRPGVQIMSLCIRKSPQAGKGSFGKAHISKETLPAFHTTFSDISICLGCERAQKQTFLLVPGCCQAHAVVRGAC